MVRSLIHSLVYFGDGGLFLYFILASFLHVFHVLLFSLSPTPIVSVSLSPRPPLFFPLFHFLDSSLPAFPSCFLCVCLCGDRREGDGVGCECWEKGGRLVSNSVMRCLAMPASALLPRINGSLTCHVPRGPTGRRRAGLMRPRRRDTCRGRDGRVCYAETSGA